MTTYLESFRKWVRRVYATWDKELDCDGFFKAIPKYVDMEVAGEKANLCFPEIEQHLGQCPECCDLYLTLRDVALLESQQVARQATPESVAFQRSQTRQFSQRR
jgi:predicted anti-sigma-YlaC factor YlaD